MFLSAPARSCWPSPVGGRISQTQALLLADKDAASIALLANGVDVILSDHQQPGLYEVSVWATVTVTVLLAVAPQVSVMLS